MQAALMLRSKERMQRRRELRRKGGEIPSNKITKDIPPYPRYPPESWVKMFFNMIIIKS